MSKEREILKTAMARTADCPELPVLLDAVENGDPTAQAHVEACPRCRAEIALFRDVAAAQPLPDASVRTLDERWKSAIRADRRSTRGGERWWNRWMRPVVWAPAMAGAAMLLVLAGVGVHKSGQIAETTGLDPERAATVEMISPKGELPAAPETLKWTAVPGAESYRVRVLEVDRNVLWETTANVPTTQIPANVQRQALPGKRLIWTVEALNSRGEAIASGSQDFRRTVVRKD